MSQWFGSFWNAVLQCFCIGVNIWMAAFQFYKHRPGAAAINSGAVIFIIVANILGVCLMRRAHATVRAALAARQAEIIRGLEARAMGPEAMAKAEKNLALVVKALNVEVQGNCYFLKVKKQMFRVSPGASMNAVQAIRPSKAHACNTAACQRPKPSHACSCCSRRTPAFSTSGATTQGRIMVRELYPILYPMYPKTALFSAHMAPLGITLNQQKANKYALFCGFRAWRKRVGVEPTSGNIP